MENQRAAIESLRQNLASLSIALNDLGRNLIGYGLGQSPPNIATTNNHHPFDRVVDLSQLLGHHTNMLGGR